MIMKANKQIGFIYKDNESIDRILKDGEVVFERGFLREKTSTTLPITFGGVGKDLKDYKIYGNTYQNSTTGKNLFYKTSALWYNNVTNGELTTRNDAYGYIAKLTAGTYTISASNNNRFVYILLDTEPINHTTYSSITNVGNTTTTTTFTVSENKYLWFGCYRGTDTSVINSIKAQLEEGPVATEFEPYTGGQPSPNPNYPQEIISCGDRTGNLFDKSTVTHGYYINDTTGITATNPTYAQEANASDYIPISGDSISIYSNPIGKWRWGAFYDSNKTFVSGITGYNKTITIPENARYMRLTVVDEILDTIMVNLGSTALPYEPYGYKIPVNVKSDNLFDKDDINIEDNKYLTSDGSYSDNSNFKVTDYIPIKSSTIYNLSPYRNYSAYECFYDENKTFISSIRISNINNTFTTPSNAKYIRLSVRKSDNDELMLIEGSTAPSKYIPYYNETTNIYLDEPLRKIDGYSDYIDFINGKVVRRIKETIYDGTENWEKYLLTFLIRNTPHTATICYCNRFISTITTQWVSNDTSNRGKISTNNVIDQIKIMPIDENINTLELWKTWLSSNNVIVDYVLSTSTEESITLPNIPTVDGNNTLNIETEITPSQVYIKYKSNE